MHRCGVVGACHACQPLAFFHPQIARLLLQYGATVDTARTDGATALYLSAQEGRASMAALLLDSGADANRARVRRGLPLFWVAVFSLFFFLSSLESWNPAPASPERWRHAPTDFIPERLRGGGATCATHAPVLH